MKKLKPGAEALFVANLPFTLTDQQLGELFDPFGIVVTSRVARDPTGQSRGFGFVELATEKARAKAIAAVNGRQIDGRTIEVRQTEAPDRPAKPGKPVARPSQPAAAAPAASREQPAPAPAKRAVLVEYRKLSEHRWRHAS